MAANSFTLCCLLIAVLLVGSKAQIEQAPTNCSTQGGVADASLCRNNSVCEETTLQCSCISSFFSPSGLNNDCRSVNEPDPRCAEYDSLCVSCGVTYQGPCKRCPDFLVQSEGSVTCVTICEDPDGFHITVLPNATIAARVCDDVSSGNLTSLPIWAVIVIAVVAVAIIITIVVVGVAFIAFSILAKSSQGQFDVEDSHQQLPEHLKNSDSPGGTLRTRRSNSFSFQRKRNEKNNKIIAHANPTFEDEIDGDDETVFKHKLGYLRSQSEVYLRMLNDMRRRLKELPPDAPAAQQYKNVMRDVTRLLYILNKKPSTVEMPPDGIQLLKWSEQILERYLASQGISPNNKQTYRLSALGPQEETNF